MPLSTKQRSHLRSLAHDLKPVVSLGNAGYTEAVSKEIEVALAHHELIKIKLGGVEKAAQKPLTEEICQQLRCESVQNIGHIAIVYRKAEKPRIKLPNI